MTQNEHTEQPLSMPQPRSEPRARMRLPASEELFPYLALNVVRHWPGLAPTTGVVVYAIQRDASTPPAVSPDRMAGGLDQWEPTAEEARRPHWANPVLSADDHDCFVQPVGVGKKFFDHMVAHHRGRGVTVAASTPVQSEQVDAAYDSVRLALRLVTSGLVKPSKGLVVARTPAQTDPGYFMGRDAFEEILPVLATLAAQPAAVRARLAQTLLVLITGNETRHRVARAVGVCDTTVRNYIHTIEDILGDRPYQPRCAVQLITTLPHLIHLWSSEG